MDNLSDKDLGEYLNSLTQQELEKLLLSIDEYEEEPVYMEEFIDSDKFLGRYFEFNCNEARKQDLLNIFPSPYYSPYFLIILRGAIGTYKTSTACAGIAYEIYKLLCRKVPQKELGVLDSTKIIFALFNITLSLAGNVVWDKLSQMFVSSPYFSKIINLDKKRKFRDTLFPKRVDVFMGSRLSHSLGQSIHSSIFSESNFDILTDQFLETFTSVIRRMESRFLSVGGGFPGKIWVDSSETGKFSNVNQIIDQYKDKEGVYCSKAALYDIKTHKSGIPLYSGKKFQVFIGSETKPAAIITKENTKLLSSDSDLCIDVPVEFKDSYEANLESSLRDISGIATVSSYKLFRYKDKLSNAFRNTNIFPDTIKLDFDNDEESIISYCAIPDYFSKPINKGIPRCIGIDMGYAKDRLGIASGYIIDFQDKEMRDPTTFEVTKISEPIINIEFAFGIEPVTGKQVPLYKIRLFVQYLITMGYPIYVISADSFQSIDTLQFFQKESLNIQPYSVDKSSLPYIRYKNAINATQCFLPQNQILKRELSELDILEDGKKVDHPKYFSGGGKELATKDISDATCQVYNTALESMDKLRLYLSVLKDQDDTKEELKNLFGW